MICFYKRLKVLIAVGLVLATLFLCGCNDLPSKTQTPYFENGLVVTFVDVGQGDCTFIRFPDGKNMIIDVGATDSGYESLTALLKAYSVSTIDYLVLSHPDLDHVGNALTLIEDYAVLNAYLPDVKNTTSYATFNLVKTALIQKQVNLHVSLPLLEIDASDYYLCFLSPIGRGSLQGYYNEFNLTVNPTDKQENNLSPMIYLRYKGVRFLFAGDSDDSQEALLLLHYQLGEYSSFTKSVKLENLDVLKVAHHGSGSSSSQEFLNLLAPKTAVISVGGKNPYGLPSTSTINRLTALKSGCKILRTDVNGSVSVHVTDYGKHDLYYA